MTTKPLTGQEWLTVEMADWRSDPIGRVVGVVADLGILQEDTVHFPLGPVRLEQIQRPVDWR